MSSHNLNQSSQAYKDSKDSQPLTSARRGSFLSSLFSMPSPTSPSIPPHHSLSSSTGSNSTTSVSPSASSLATHHEDHHALSGSPASSVASPLDSKFSPSEWSTNPPHSRQTSLTDSLSGLTSSFRWPGSTATSNVQPISIPNSHPSSQTNHNHGPQPTPTPMVGTSAPTRRTSVAGPTFRRAFELPTYTNTYNQPDPPQDSHPQADPNRRGRSGSLFSSFGVAAGDASKRTSGPPRRKLSPMGERMIRDHPF